MSSQFDGAGIETQILKIARPYRLKAIGDAIKQADAAEDLHWRLMFRYMYASEATFHDDPPKAMPAAAEFAQIFEQHPDALGPDGKEAYVMIMQLAIDPIVSLPQIPLKQWEQMMEQFWQLIKRYHIGHRIYWWQKCQFTIYLDLDQAFAYYQKFWKTGRDVLSDCRACEHSYGVKMHLLMGDYEGAEKCAKPIKSKHLWFCNDTPHKMLVAYIEDAMDRGDLTTALPYARQLKRIGHRDRGDLSYMGAVLRCFAYDDKATALDLIEEGLPWSVGLWDQKMIYDFYKGVWTVFHQIGKERETLHIHIPNQLAVYREDGTYEVSALEEWVYTQLQDVAGRFDQRNGTDYFAKNLEKAVTILA